MTASTRVTSVKRNCAAARRWTNTYGELTCALTPTDAPPVAWASSGAPGCSDTDSDAPPWRHRRPRQTFLRHTPEVLLLNFTCKIVQPCCVFDTAALIKASSFKCFGCKLIVTIAAGLKEMGALVEMAVCFLYFCAFVDGRVDVCLPLYLTFIVNFNKAACNG